MEISKPIEVSSISEIKILQDVRLIHRHDMNPIHSKENLRVQFEITGEIKGAITCYLCLDGHDLLPVERNYFFPLFVETMNILVGRQMGMDKTLKEFKLKLSAPKLSMIPQEINTSYKSLMQKYELELEAITFNVLTEYNLEAIN